MSEIKPKVIKKSDTERQKENERSLEVNYLKMLMRKYPEKARKFVSELRSQTV